jgi:hypothetical protein
MSERSFNDRHGSLTDGTVLRMQRRLPGPIERVWSYRPTASCDGSGWPPV